MENNDKKILINLYHLPIGLKAKVYRDNLKIIVKYFDDKQLVAVSSLSSRMWKKINANGYKAIIKFLSEKIINDDCLMVVKDAWDWDSDK